MLTHQQLHAQLSLFNDNAIVRFRRFYGYELETSYFWESTAGDLKCKIYAKVSSPVTFTVFNPTLYVERVTLGEDCILITLAEQRGWEMWLNPTEDEPDASQGTYYIEQLIEDCDPLMAFGELRPHLKTAIKMEGLGEELVKAFRDFKGK